MIAVKSCVGVLMFFCIVYCIKVVPERAKVLFVDPDYLSFSKLYVTRHGRKSGYYLNLEGDAIRPWYNNMTVHLIFYEYLHNEYRRSFVEMHFKVCDFLSNESFVGGMFKNLGVSCPVMGEYHLMNMSCPTDNFPYVFPFSKFMVNIFLNVTETNHMIYQSQVHCHITDK